MIKFTDVIEADDFQVLSSDNEYIDILSVNKTVPYDTYEITLENGTVIKCADTHILINEKCKEVYAKDTLGQLLITREGTSKVISVKNTGIKKEMYDLSLAEKHTFFTNNVLSHNTTTASIIILHYIIFNDAKQVAILANKESASIEVLDRIKMAYETLPAWMQRGVKEWNKKSILLENKSKVLAAATSSDSIRGKTCVTADTIVTVVDDKGIIYNISICDLIKKNPINYKIYDGKRFESFKGILNKGMSNGLLELHFNNSVLKCTKDHLIYDGNEFVEASNLTAGQSINGDLLIGIKSISDEIVYDILEVENSHSYMSNNIISHNCNMIYIDECVGKDTTVIIFDAIDNKLYQYTMEELYHKINSIKTTEKEILDEVEFCFNNEFMVLTDIKMCQFKGIKKSKGETLFIYFDDETYIECTHSHLFKREGEFIEAKTLVIGDYLSDKKIIKIEYNNELRDVYDLLNIEDGNEYLTNGIVSHNCAFIDNWSDFYASTYPTITSGKTSKLLMTSTPKGSQNHFYDFWRGATIGYTDEKGNVTYNGFVPISAPYWVIPGRDDKWKEDTLASLNYDYDRFLQEYCCEFMGSSTTLLSGQTLKKLSHINPIIQNDYMKQYELPIISKEKPDLSHIYFMTVDVSRGKGLDYSTFSIFDISVVPYNQVCTFRCNTILPVDFAIIIYNMARIYNECFVLIELNDLGKQTADYLKDDLEYDNIIAMQKGGRNGQRICAGYAKNMEYGITTSTAVKKIGCSLLKLLVEQNKIKINDLVTVKELMGFSKDSKNGFAAPVGQHDDMVMTLVIFAYVTQDQYFIGLTDVSIMKLLREQSVEEIEESLIPFGVINSPLDDLKPKYVKFEGEKDVWQEHDSFGW